MATITYVRRDPRTGELMPVAPPHSRARVVPQVEDTGDILGPVSWAPEVYHAPPPDYHGFVARTYAEIRYLRDDGSHEGLLTFQGSSVEAPVRVPFRFVPDLETRFWSPEEDEGGYGLGPTAADIPATGIATATVEIAREPSRLQQYPTTREPLWGLIVDTNRFDRVTLSVSSPRIASPSVWVKRIRIVLNHVRILDLSFRRPVELRPDEPWVLDGFIRVRRWERAHLYDLPGLFGYRSLDDVLPLVRLAADDLGQAWDPRYCPWDRDENHPVPWCSEYIAWLISRATGGRHIINPDRGSIDISENPLARYYEEHARYITPATHDYRQLGEVIRPGDLVQVDRGGHTTIFVCWITAPTEQGFFGPTRTRPVDGGGVLRPSSWRIGPGLDPSSWIPVPNYTPVPFHANWPVNHFLAIGGNQRVVAHADATDKERRGRFRGLNVIDANIFSITNVPPDDEPDPTKWPSIVWINNTDYIGEKAFANYPDAAERARHNTPYFDGFGDSGLLFRRIAFPSHGNRTG